MESKKLLINESMENKTESKKLPLVIKTEKWNSILKHLNRNKDIVEQSEEEKKFKEYLKEGSHEMTSKWTNTVENKRNRKFIDKEDKYKQKAIEGELKFKELKENDEKVRLEQVAKAQELIQRLKVGPKELDSAAMLCEVLKGQEIQRNLNVSMAKAQQERQIKENEKAKLQANRWIEEEQKKMLENKKRNLDYKNEVFKQLQQEEHRKLEYSKRQTGYEKRVREQADQDLKSQIDRERAILERKKETMRRNALDAMKMVEQRRLRDKVQDEVENKIIEIYKKGKQTIEEIKMEKEKKRQEEIARFKEGNAKKIFLLTNDKSGSEDERYNKSVIDLTSKMDIQEKERVQREKTLKAARIQQHLDYMENQRQAKTKEVDLVRWSIANRLKNEQVTHEFEIQKHENKMKKSQEIRSILLEQMKERQIKEQKSREENMKVLSQDNETDDKYFMQYSNILIEDAKKKQRPILPLIKATERYKKHYELDMEVHQPKHLQSNIPIDDKVDRICDKNSEKTIIKYDVNELKNLNPYLYKPMAVWPPY